MKKFTKWILTITIGILLIVAATYFVIKNKEYQPTNTAMNASSTTTTVDNSIKFQGDDTRPAVIFYPGALVEPKSYSVWANEVSKAGYSVYIVRFPLDLAVMNANAAKKVQANKPYIIGGHSLGGTMAARYAVKNKKELRGIFFLASYPEKKGNLRHVKVPVLSITASQDGVLNKGNYNKAKKLLPASTKYLVINGGNHAGFGSYGKQKGDEEASIKNSDQQKITASLLIHWLNSKID
ncbi:alpha/beta hydrolase [Companilactobacillus baiquanensis]|uniref:Alpha/beta hydrolase n=1 Tax=Companilactobacillus baiquanensis TaxID=2486005 RepID=A0ABW1UXQ7_9LACO|nr:alpha/beta hydrolase [Companilactobacillus baiquanensis]